MRTLFRILAVSYAVFIGVLIAWAWVADLVWINSRQEHLGPDFLLSMSSLPTSLLADLPCTPSNGYCGGQLGQLALATICAVTQVGALLILARGWRRRPRAASGS